MSSIVRKIILKRTSDFAENVEARTLGHYYFRFSGLLFWETSKFIIINTAKGGSSITRHLVEDNNLLESYFNWGAYESRNDKDIYNFKIYEDEVPTFIYDLINGNTNKDIIILHRNPIYKFLSGVIQDISNELKNDALYTTFLKDKFPEFNKDLFFEIYYKIEHNKIDSDNIPEWFINVTYEMVLEYLISNFQKFGKCNTNHSLLTNELFYDFITYFDKIPRDRLKIFDIDQPKNDVVKLIKSYYPHIKFVDYFWTQRNLWKLFFNKALNELSLNEEFKNVDKKLHTELNNDYYYYYKIKKTFKEQVLDYN